MPVDFAPLHKAHATLKQGTNHVTSWARSDRSRAVTRNTLIHTRMLGNCLREFDRFLSICMDEAARHIDPSTPWDPAFTRLRNTPNKLCLVEERTGAATTRHDRLRAIGRISACLHHCSGQIHDPGIHHDVALAHGTGWHPMPANRPPGAGPARLSLTAMTVIRISLFYREIGDDLLARALHPAPILDFSPPTCHLERANVACDGI